MDRQVADTEKWQFDHFDQYSWESENKPLVHPGKVDLHVTQTHLPSLSCYPLILIIIVLHYET